MDLEARDTNSWATDPRGIAAWWGRLKPLVLQTQLFHTYLEQFSRDFITTLLSQWKSQHKLASFRRALKMALYSVTVTNLTLIAPWFHSRHMHRSVHRWPVLQYNCPELQPGLHGWAPGETRPPVYTGLYPGVFFHAYLIWRHFGAKLYDVIGTTT